MRLWALAMTLALVAVVLPTTAIADHAYSHRYIIYGRVVDAAGAPIQGLVVQPQLIGITPEGECDARHPPVSQLTTDELGDYFWCQHTHRITTNSATWKVTAGNGTATGAVDPDVRKSRADIQLPDNFPSRRGDLAKFNKSYEAFVVLWKPGETAIEGITVEGTALTARSVTAVLTYNGNKTATKQGTTGDYGDVTLTFDLAEDLVSGRLKVTGPRDQVVEVDVDPKFHASSVTLYYPGDPWWSNTGLVGFAVVAGLAVAGGIAYGIFRFMKTREMAQSAGRRRR